MGDWALGSTPSLASDGGNWYDPVVADLESNPEAAVQKYGELAKGLPDYAAGRIQQAAIAGATAAGTAACLAAGAAAPVCAGVVLIIAPLVSAIFDAFSSGGQRATSLPVIATDPNAPFRVSALEMAQLINKSEDLRRDEEDAVSLLADQYKQGIRTLIGADTSDDEARGIAARALAAAGYTFPLITTGPSALEVNELPGWDQAVTGQSWQDHVNDVCDPSKNNFLACTPGNSVWSNVDASESAGRGSYQAAAKETRARIYALPAAILKAGSLITARLSEIGIGHAAGMNLAAAAYGKAAASAGSEYLANLEKTDPEKFQAMQNAAASGDDPAAASRQIDNQRSGFEVGNTGSQAVMPAGSAGIGTAVLLLGGLGLLMLLAKRGGR